MEPIITSIYENVISGNRSGVEQGVKQAMADNVPAEAILNQGLIDAMNEVGRRFEEGDFFVPEMLIAARAMQTGLNLLQPTLVAEGVKGKGKVLIGTVKGDLHDIGKNLVGMMLEGAGFTVVDLGSDVAPDKFVAAFKEHQPDVVGMSALLTTTMQNMKETIHALENAGLRSQVKIVIGGAPVTHEYAQQIGADGYAPDASRAVSLVKSLLP